MSEAFERPKVLFVLPSLRGGGAERVTIILLRHLNRDHFEPHLALVKAEGSLLDSVPSDVPIHDLRARRVRYAIPAYVNLAWKLKPDLVISSLGYLNFSLILARLFLPRKTKLIVREGTTASVHVVRDVPYPRLWSWCYRNLYSNSEAIVCQSDYMLNDLAEQFGIPKARMVRIYNPVDYESIQTWAAANGNPYPRGGPQLVAIGRLSREKGLDVLLEAMAVVSNRVPSARLSILGIGPLELELTAKMAQLGLGEAVSLVGFKANPYPYIKYADLFVHPSFYEGLPNALLEALALGKPIVATESVGGVGEVLRNDAGSRLVKPRDPRSLAEGILASLASSPSEAFLQKRESLLSKFEVRNVVRQYEQLFREITHGNSF